MRISDWSSDVCSSDLEDHGFARFGLGGAKEVRLLALGHVVLPCFDYTSGAVILHDLPHAHGSLPVGFLVAFGDREDEPLNVRIGRGCAFLDDRIEAAIDHPRAVKRHRVFLRIEALVALHRSEEHTSELQSLMRLSYA